VYPVDSHTALSIEPLLFLKLPLSYTPCSHNDYLR
jgi:hypothetical protein